MPHSQELLSEIVKYVDIWDRGRPLLLGEVVRTINSASQLYFKRSMSHLSVLLKHSVFITISNISQRLEFIFQDVRYVKFLVDLEAFPWRGRNKLKKCWMSTIILMSKRLFNSERFLISEDDIWHRDNTNQIQKLHILRSLLSIVATDKSWIFVIL